MDKIKTMDKKSTEKKVNPKQGIDKKNTDKKNIDKKDTGIKNTDKKNITGKNIDKKNTARKNTDKKKSDKRKPKYKASYCMKWLLRTAWEWDRKLSGVMVLFVLLSIGLYALNLYIPSMILDSLQTSDSFRTVAFTITTLLFAQLLFQIFKICGEQYTDYSLLRNAYYFHWRLQDKRQRDDYQLSLEEDYRKLVDRAFGIFYSDTGSPIGALINFGNVVVNIVCFLLFGTVISILSPWILVLLALGVLLSFFLKRRVTDMNYSDREPRDANQKRMNYYSDKLPRQYKMGKDIRVFGFLEYMQGRWRLDSEEYIRLSRIVQNRWTVVLVLAYFIDFLRDGTAYLYLIRGAVAGGITPAQFVLYFSAISQMSKFMSGIMDYFSNLHESMLTVSDLIEFLCEDRGRNNHGKGIPVPKDRPVALELRNVSFRYPGGERNILEHVDMKVEAGEHVSIVGMNGAGKTTLTLLLCGLLTPDEGEVLIDGHPVTEYNRDELYGIFSVVPQKYSVLPVSVAENIGMCDRAKMDDVRLWECIGKVGLSDKIKGLKNGVETGMNKMYDTDAVEFSGGEMQRLLLARALYRDASVLILDEPTAALDPIAEDEIYRKYAQFSQNTTSFFISHRMASTRFCDRIYLLDGAVLAETGTHEELLALDGKYAEMYRVQSRYYTEEKGEGGEESNG